MGMRWSWLGMRSGGFVPGGGFLRLRGSGSKSVLSICRLWLLLVACCIILLSSSMRQCRMKG
ncbi:hypothetical protein JHK85_037209 [Glycine max]|nr:hypothetical protein JHK85_037209 [Glycine max]